MDNIGENKKNTESFPGNKKRKNNYYNKNYHNKKKNFKNDKAFKKEEAEDIEMEMNAMLEPNGIRILPQAQVKAERNPPAARAASGDAAKEKPPFQKQYNKPNAPKFNKNNSPAQNAPRANASPEEKNFRPRTDKPVRTANVPSSAAPVNNAETPQWKSKPNSNLPRRKPKKAADIHSVLKTYADLHDGEEVPVQAAPIAVEEPESLSVLPVESPAEPDVERTEIIGVRYKPVGKIYFFDPGDIKFSRDDAVIVETTKGVELGFVAIANRREPAANIVHPLKPIMRVADEKDIAHYEENKVRARETMRVAREKIQTRGLKMKLIDAEYTFDNMKLLYYFAADGRVDFRELAKDLAAIFKVRIDLRQIGVRDQPKMMGGISICGRAFCCNTFLPVLDQVSIKMAKDQNISINSAKISGACGKLMCCLKYEQEMYERESLTTPKVNSIVETPDGTGVVIDANIISGIVRVSMNHSGEGRIIKNVHKSAVKVIGFLKSAESENKSSESEK